VPESPFSYLEEFVEIVSYLEVSEGGDEGPKINIIQVIEDL
jgi:hypothetical protein